MDYIEIIKGEEFRMGRRSDGGLDGGKRAWASS